MADLEDVTLDGRPLQSLRVADLKAALEERGLSKSGQKNALIKRLKGALMLENLQRTSTAHIGLQPNSQIGEEMSQNSFIKQYLAKQQELLRQRLEREAREAYETNEQEDHSEVNNSTSCPPQSQDVTAALPEQHKPPGPSSAEGLFGTGNEGEGNRKQEADIPGPPASGSVAMRVPGGEHRPERGSASSEVAADSDDEDGDDDDWDSSARRNLREPARVPMSRDRSGPCQPQQQHIPSLLSPQLRQPTPPPSPPPELSFPLPDTPKQSPPSPDVAPARHSPSTSSSGSSSSGSRSSSPEPQRSGDGGRKPGPLTLLARKMESEGAFSGASWHGGDGEGDRQDSSSPSATLGLISAITHTANTSGHVSFPMILGTTHGVTGAHSAHIQVPMSVLRATATEERDCEIEREKALELERLEKQRKLERERALEADRARALALEREEKQKALEKERIERQQALEREEREKVLQHERELALEQERQERALTLAKEREEREQALAREKALEQEKQRELERQRALEQERLEREREEREKREREEMERAMELERAKALEKEREERERALELERLEMERALEAERIQREKALEQERLKQERLEREKALEQERIEREKALEQERLEREKALEQERIEREKALEQERIDREEALEQERIEREKALEQERLERERALEQERLELEKKEKERLEREKALEHERIERQKALDRENKEKEKAEREAALEQERMEKERAEKESKERAEEERLEEEKERALEHERLEKEKAMLKEKEEQEMALKQEKERTTMAEKDREIYLPPSKRDREIGLIPLPTGTVRKSSTEAEEQEGVNAPMARSEAQTVELGAPMSPQSSCKKFRFLRDPPIQQHSSSTSMIIKRPHTFSDNPHPQASPVSSPTSVGRYQEGHHPPAEREDSETQTKREVGSPTESVETQFEEEGIVSTTLRQISKAEECVTLEDKKQSGSVKTDQDVKECTIEAKEIDESKSPSSPMETAQRRGRDAKKEEKQTRQRSSSNDSSSSESDSGSSSSRSSGSSTSSQEKTTSTSRVRREGKPEGDASPQHRVTAEAQPVETSKASLLMSGGKTNTTADTVSHMEEPFIKVPAREERQRTRKASHEEEEKDKQRQVKELAMAESEKIPETSEEVLMLLPLPLLVPAYYYCQYYYFYCYCCTCSTFPKSPELTTDKPMRLHYRETPLAKKAASFSWIFLARAIYWTRRFKGEVG